MTRRPASTLTSPSLTDRACRAWGWTPYRDILFSFLSRETDRGQFPSFDATAFERDQASSRGEPNATDPFGPGGVFGDGQLELPWRFPSPYAHPLPLGLDVNRVPLELDDNARYAMGLPSHHTMSRDGDEDDAAAIKPVTCHPEQRGLPTGRNAGPGLELPSYHSPLTPAEDDRGQGPGRVVHQSLEVPKTRDMSPLPSAAFRQSDPFVEKNPLTRPPQQRPRAPTPATMKSLAYGLGPADARLRLPAELFAVGGGAEPTPTRSAAASRAPTSASLFASGDGGGGTAKNRRPSSTTPSPLSVSPLSLGRAGSVATIRDLRAVAPPHRQISIRSLAPAAPPDRPIIVTNALNHILYDGPCRHCEVNSCVCLLPSSAPSPWGAAADNDDDNPATPFGTAAPWQQRDNDIMTEGFCRHCVVNHCACVGDAKWGLHHAANALRNARLDGDHHDTATRRLVSDSGTVRRYETTWTEAEDGGGDGGTSSHHTLHTGRASPPFAAPLPAYLPMGRERVSSVDRAGFCDLEAQPRRDGSGGSGSSGRGMVSTFHFRHSFRAGGAGQDASLGGRRKKRNRLASFVAGHLCRIFVAVIFLLLIAVMAWVVWFYTERDGVPIT